MTTAPAELSEALTLRCEVAQPWEAQAEVLVVALPAGGSAPAWLAPWAEQVGALEEGEALSIPRGAGSPFHATRVEVVALTAPTPDSARRLGRRVGDEHRARSTFAVSGLPLTGPDAAGLAFVTGLAEARYRFTRYRSDAGAPAATVSFVGVPSTAVADVRRGLRRTEVIESSVRWCRDLTNTPARDLTPETFAAEAVREAERCGVVARVHDEAWLEAEGFAGLVSVGAGSLHPPRLVELTFRGAEAGHEPPLVLVGKGITFDSGGLSLKKASAMVEMKSDMAGAATVAAAITAIARLDAPRAHVVALLPLAENLPGPGALRPGDIIRHRNALTTEVVNTDCEGRLVLSDALAWAAERSPAAIVDVATLTYATISALGMDITSVIGNDPALIERLCSAGRQTGDPFWELPLWEPYRRLIESPFADLRNEELDDAPGAIAAALYLREFVGRTPWAHLDTGGTAYLDRETDHLGAGATGNAVRGLIRFALDRQHTEENPS